MRDALAFLFFLVVWALCFVAFNPANAASSPGIYIETVEGLGLLMAGGVVILAIGMILGHCLTRRTAVVLDEEPYGDTTRWTR